MRRDLGCVQVALMVATTVFSLASPSSAQPPKEKDLAAARRLFAQALKEEEQGQFEPALEKYRRIQEIKDTAPVRYRIGTSLEGLGRLREALTSFHSAIEAARDEASQTDVAHASEEHAAELERRIPQLLLIVPDRAPPDLVVEVDHEVVSEGSLRTPLPLDPGSHDVRATAATVTPFHTQVALTDGAHVSLTIPLELLPPPRPVEPPPRPPERPAPVHGGGPLRTVGIVTMIGGGAMLAGSVAALILRQSDADTLRHACNGDLCPSSRRDELTATRSRAVTEGTVAGVLGIAGLVVLGGGGALFLVSGSTRVTAAPTRGGGQFVLTAALP